MKISVITVCFNSEATIAYAIESFLAQDYSDKELVIVDGASTDRTLEIVASFKSPLIRHYSEPDAGLFDAMNKGLRLFEGDAVGFLNSDDTFHDSRALQKVAAGLTGSDIAYGDLHMVVDQRSKKLVRFWRGGTFGSNSFHLGWQPPHPTFYMRRRVVERVGDFDLQYRQASDYDYMLRAMVLNKFRVAYIPYVLIDFQMGGVSTKDWSASLRGNIECLRSRQIHLGAPLVDPAALLRPFRRLFQIRRIGRWRPN